MLAQPFQSAADLKITEPQKDALIKTLVLLETGKLAHAPEAKDHYYGNLSEDFTAHFNMSHWNSAVPDCGTVACIGGTAELIGGVKFRGDDEPLWSDGLYELFMPSLTDVEWYTITPAQAARALRSYLTTGDAKWAEAVSA